MGFGFHKQGEKVLVNLDGADLWQVGRARSELNSDLTIRHGDGESLADSSQRSPSRGNDVKVGQDLRTVDRDIKNAFPRGGPVDLGELQSDSVAAVRDGKLIGELSVALCLVEFGIGRVRDVAGCAESGTT